MNGESITTNKGFIICSQLAGYSQPRSILFVYSLAKILKELPPWSNPDQNKAAPINKIKIKVTLFFSFPFNPPKTKI